MEPRSNRNERRSHNDEHKRYASSTHDRDQHRYSRHEKDPSSHYRRGDIKRIIWENDLYERQSL